MSVRLWQHPAMATDLRQGRGWLLWKIERMCGEDAAYATEVHGREKVLEINPEDPALPTVDRGIWLWATTAREAVDVRAWRVGAIEHRQQSTLEVLDRLNWRADDARSTSHAPVNLKLVIAAVLVVGPDPPGQKTQRRADVPGYVGTSQENRDVGGWL
jgi:hypothetical protein